MQGPGQNGPEMGGLTNAKAMSVATAIPIEVKNPILLTRRPSVISDKVAFLGFFIHFSP